MYIENPKSYNEIIKEMCQVSNIFITAAGEGKADNINLVHLTQIIDNWKYNLENIGRGNKSKMNNVDFETWYIKTQGCCIAKMKDHYKKMGWSLWFNNDLEYLKNQYKMEVNKI
jgi:hypothetical protein